MSRLDDLIAELCPDGVEFKRLGGIDGICEVLSSGVDKVLVKNERPVKLCNYMDVYNNQYITAELISGFMDGSVNDSEYQKFVLRAGQVLLTKDSETREDIAQSAYVLKDFDDVVCGYHLAVLTPISNIDGKYLNYVLQSNTTRRYFSRMANGVSRFGLKLKSIENALIPVPPLPVQQEIVRILDKFTMLEAELEAELEARKKQYDYYRDELLTFSDNVVRKMLGEVCKFKYGYTNKAKDYGNARFIRITDINENGKLRHGDEKFVNIKGDDNDYLLRNGDLLVARTGATFGKTLLFDEKVKACYASFLIRIRFIDNNILPSYYWHFAQSRYYWQQASLLVSNSGGQPQFNANVLSKVRIPLPPLAKQKRIVAILDRFDTLVNDITQGLPAEIAARRRQYEYYRDKLLTFKEVI